MFRSSISFLILFFSIQSFAASVYTTSSDKSCYGLVLSLLSSNSKYTTIKNFDAKVFDKPFGSVLPSKDLKPTAKKMYSFFNKTIPVEVLESNTSKPLEKLNQKSLYTFVLTEKELRFAETTRRTGAIKNFLSKHFYLSRGEPVYYAGEAWFEDGILVVNHNSGTFRPKAEDLPAVAEYFQKALNVEEVHFSNTLPAQEPFLPIKAYADQFKGYISSLKTAFSSTVIHFFTRNAYQKEIISVGLDGKPGKDVVFQVGDKIGNGFYGVVHRATILSVSRQATIKHPEFLVDGSLSTKLVVKFPNNVPLLHSFPYGNIFERAILNEKNEFHTLASAANNYYNKAADIVFSGKHGKVSFLLKNLVEAISFEKLAQKHPKLSKEQITSLEDDVYELAVSIKKSLNLDLDIKAENLAWDESQKRFVLYELSVRQSGGYVTKGGFSEYLAYVNVRLNHWNLQRVPSSAQPPAKIFTLVKDNSFIVPSSFSKKFSTPDGFFVFDMKDSKITFKDAFLNGNFKYEAFVINESFSQIIFSLFDPATPEKKIRMAIRKDNSAEDYSMIYEVLVGNEIIANSIFYKLNFE